MSKIIVTIVGAALIAFVAWFFFGPSTSSGRGLSAGSRQGKKKSGMEGMSAMEGMDHPG